jgi:hypothetical protein
MFATWQSSQPPLHSFVSSMIHRSNAMKWPGTVLASVRVPLHLSGIDMTFFCRHVWALIQRKRILTTEDKDRTVLYKLSKTSRQRSRFAWDQKSTIFDGVQMEKSEDVDRVVQLIIERPKFNVMK